jgi:hypothetical protein
MKVDKPYMSKKITVIVPDPGDYSHVYGTFRFATWLAASTFVGKLAAAEVIRAGKGEDDG